MATFGLKLGSFTLNSNNGIIIQSFSEPLTSRANPANIPRQHGGNLDSSLYIEPKLITLSGLITGANQAGYRTYKDAFRAALEGGRQKLYYFDDRYVWVQKLDLDLRDYLDGMKGFFDLSFIAADPLWYANAATSNNQTANATTANFTLASNGNAPTPPTITLLGNGANFTNPSFTNNQTGQVITFTGAGANLVINMANMTANLAGNSCLSNMSGEFWKMNAGNTTVNFVQDAANDVSINFGWTDRWW